MKNLSQQKGFALLIGVVVATILISITFIMFNISLKQLALSTAGKNSQTAFYIADTGTECTLFADTHVDQAFVAVTPSVDGSGNVTLALSSPGTKTTVCNTKTITYTPTVGTVTAGGTTYAAIVTNFTVDTSNGEPPCATVIISKYKVPKVINGITIDVLKTKLQSRGYNTCVNANDPLRFERGLEVNY